MSYNMIEITTSSINPKSSILLIYTGGTFGMVYDSDGSLAPFDFHLVVEKIPELHTLDISLTVLSFQNPIDSSNVNLYQWKKLATIIHDKYNQFDGFVVLHGTDTMAYTTSAMSFMLQEVNKPIIFTGAQIPIGATRSDARENLITALEISSKRKGNQAEVNEVGLYFNYVLYKGNRSKKIRSSHFAAFASENYPHLAEVGVEIKYNKNVLSPYQEGEPLKINTNFDSNVVIVKLFPGMTPKILDAMLSIKGLKGIILETYGSGNIMNDQWVMDRLIMANKKDIVVFNVSQCIGGSVMLGQYEASKRLIDIGVVSGLDITTEAAVTKMMYVLGTETSLKQVKLKLSQSISGEMTMIR